MWQQEDWTSPISSMLFTTRQAFSFLLLCLAFNIFDCLCPNDMSYVPCLDKQINCNTNQVPRTSETYVHRSGRTARASKEGLSLLLIGPDDMMNFKKIYKTLGKDEELPMFPIETGNMVAIKVRLGFSFRLHIETDCFIVNCRV